MEGGLEYLRCQFPSFQFFRGVETSSVGPTDSTEHRSGIIEGRENPRPLMNLARDPLKQNCFPLIKANETLIDMTSRVTKLYELFTEEFQTIRR